MAVRFDTTGESYTRALALGTQAALTVACWFKLSVDRNDYSSPFFIDNGTSDNWGLQTGADGTTMATVFDASTQQGMGSLTVGTWYFVCLSTNGTSGNLFHKTASAAGLTTVAVTSVTASVNAATLRLGDSPWGNEWLNGCLAAVKVWTTALTAAEAQTESTQYIPDRLTNLVSWHPLVKAETTDYSGNARTLSGGAGATTEDGPPIPWRTAPTRLILPAATGGSQTADAALTVTSSSTATGVSTKPVDASLTATASLTSSATSVKSADASLSSTASLTAAGTSSKPAAASLTATASLTADMTVGAAPKLADAALTVTAGLTGTATVSKPVDAALTTTASLTATGTGSKSAAATLSITETATASGDTGAVAALTETATLTATGTSTKPVAGSLTATASLTATLTTAGQQTANAALTVTVTPTATGLVDKPVAGSLTATAGLTAGATRSRVADMTLNPSAALSAAAATSKPATSSLAATAVLTAALTVVKSAQSQLLVTAGATASGASYGGITYRPDTGTTPRGASGRTTRPNTGTTSRP